MADVKIKSLTSEEKEFIEKYRKANENKKEKINKIIFDEFKRDNSTRKC